MQNGASAIAAALCLSLLTTTEGLSVAFDFTESRGPAGWQAGADIAHLSSTPEGLSFEITGEDPQLVSGPLESAGPVSPYLNLRLHSQTGGLGQLFYFDQHALEPHSVRFPVSAGTWTDIQVPLPALREGWRLRFDPPGTSGRCVVAWLRLEEAGERGVTHLAATASELVFQVSGVAGAVELVELLPYQTLSHAAAAPVLHRVERDGPFTLPRFAGSTPAASRDRIYSGFVARQTHPRFGPVPLGSVRYVEELRGVSKWRAPFPSASSKKGLQVQMVEDALALGVKHAALNVNLTSLIDLSRDPANLTWQMDGETFYFNRNAVEHMAVKPLSDQGVVVALILLAYQSGRPELDRLMLHPDYSTEAPNRLGAFNTSTPEGLRHYKACMEFLAERFCSPAGAHGRVANFIVGNEINSHWHWYNMGRASEDVVVDDYLRAVRVANIAVRKFSSSARVYLSLEHHWAVPYEKDAMRSLAGKLLIDDFNRKARLGGNFDWHLAFHPYPENLFEPRTWNDKSALPSPDSPRITFKNLEQLTAYLERPELRHGTAVRRVILSEQGFHSDASPEGDRAQAAAYCYAWNKVRHLDGIDSFILHRHVDHRHEGGLNLGLWTRRLDSVATPAQPRPMYEVFRKADTGGWEDAFRFALPIIGIDNWRDIGPPR